MKLKQPIALLLVLIIAFSLFSCEEYVGAAGKPGGGSSIPGGEDGDVNQPELNDDPTDDFTVTVKANGESYSPRTTMYAVWTGESGVYKAPIGRDGVARIDGLDGDYLVTLTGVPNEYTYNPNGCYATNDERNQTVNLYTLNRLSGSGTGIYDCYTFKDIGVYCAEIAKPGDGIFFEYAPTTNGIYTIESWIDVTADNINPYVEVYNGTTQYKYLDRTIDDGGPVGSYTINFVHTVTIADENISDAGQAVFTFAVKADSKNNQYPITVTFAVGRNGDYSSPPHGVVEKSTAIPKLDFDSYNVADHEYDDSQYEMKYLEYQFEGLANTYVFDDSRVKLWKKGDGGDNFYHVYDKEAYPETGGYGPILYASITGRLRFISQSGAVSFDTIEYGGNKDKGETVNAALTVDGVNYKHFIEGYTFLSTMGNINGSSYYCNDKCPCHASDTDNLDRACAVGCATCDVDCRQCPEELIGNEGYQSIVNSDGMVAVTEELQIFLEGFTRKSTYFYDGKGTLDSKPYNGINYQAVSDSGWLFACVYYAEK